jgi:hypothetical protein
VCLSHYSVLGYHQTHLRYHSYLGLMILAVCLLALCNHLIHLEGKCGLKIVRVMGVPCSKPGRLVFITCSCSSSSYNILKFNSYTDNSKSSSWHIMFLGVSKLSRKFVLCWSFDIMKISACWLIIII